jgi:acyl transferase domain-containing protein
MAPAHPPKVSEAMDDAQRWAVACTRAALLDSGWPHRPLDGERTAVILGNAMAGERHYLTNLRVVLPEVHRFMEATASFQTLPLPERVRLLAETTSVMDANLPPITEDTMPGELGNCMAGRVANLFDFHGPNFVVDAACASALAAIDASIEGLIEHEYDAVITGGIDRNMGASS